MKRFLLLAGILLSLSLLAKEVDLYVNSAANPPENAWRTNGDEFLTMEQRPWPTGESGLTVKFTYKGNARTGEEWWPSGKLYLDKVPDALTDWRLVNTLLIDIYCETDEPVGLVVKTKNDPKTFNFFDTVRSKGRHTLKAEIGEMSNFDLSAIEYIDIFCSSPKTDYSVYVGDIRLDVKDLEAEASERKTRADALRGALAWRRSMARGNLPAAIKNLMSIEKFLPEPPDVDALQDFEKACRKGFPVIDRIYFMRSAENNLAARWCAAEEKVLRETYAFLCPPTEEILLDAARGEGESAQIVAFATADLAGVKTEIEIYPVDEGGKSIPKEAFKLSPVGYVEIRNPGYNIEPLGFWPDPILEYLDTPIPVERNTYQTWWLDVNVPLDQPAGLYQGQVKLTWDNGGETTLPFSVRVRDFALPEGVPYFSPIEYFIPYPGGENVQEERDRQMVKLILDHRLQADHIYLNINRPELVESAKFRLEHGARHFNLGFINTEVDDKLFAQIAEAYRRCKEAGIIDKAYIYCFDEQPAEKFPMMREALKRIREAAPGVPIYTTLYDSTYGVASGMEELIDGWIPLTRVYGKTSKEIAAARERGAQVGWYVCCGPLYPYANFLLEIPATGNRLLMGFMNKKFTPDCFLYYYATMWCVYEIRPDGTYQQVDYIKTPIAGGRLPTLIGDPWFAESFTNFPGDGRLLYPAKEGPVPTTRLKSIRDGMEDWLYMDMLEKAWKNPGRMSAEWRDKARKEVHVEDRLVETLTKWTTDPALVRDKKARIADLLEEYYSTQK